jgi:flagellar protein FliS
MIGYSNASKLAAYSSTAAHASVAAADPHKLIVLLFDGALDRIAKARGCIERGEHAEKAQLINRAVNIIDELRGSLDMQAGGEIASNLSALYEYMSTRLLTGSVEGDVRQLDEVSGLLREIRAAWVSIPLEARAR